MMRTIWIYLMDSRRLTMIGLAALVAMFYLGAQALELALIWAIAATAVALLVAVAVWAWRRRRARRASQLLGQSIGNQAELAAAAAAASAAASTASSAPGGDEVDALRNGLLDALATIRQSKMGQVSGARALYELPWYMIIGNPAAGKSSAVINSGLQFPVADGKLVQGVGGTRHCDWFFSTDGILLDTAGRYAVQDQHRAEWFGFLDLLKKYRSRAPVNGIIIAVSVAELRGDNPQTGLDLARDLRKRVQDVIERLEVFAPVYVIFTKVDLVAGFGEFFSQMEAAERERVWGATMPYNRKLGSQQILAFFDQSYAELCAGLRDMSLATMALRRREHLPPGVFTFPQEFGTLRAPLRAFLTSLFEENRFQFKPVFRGFYFTSALQEGLPVSEQTRRIARRFELTMPETAVLPQAGKSGFFLLNLFRKVIFADRDLVSQYASRTRLQWNYALFLGAVLTLGVSLGCWSWSYIGNRQLVANVQADLDKVVKLQAQRLDLQSRLEALDIIEDRIEQLDTFRRDRPWSLRMGLYQGELLERKLRQEYFSGVRDVMLKPVVANIETLLAEMNANADKLQPAPRTGDAPPSPTAPVAPRQFVEASPLNVDDAYNALKTYLMLADTSHAEGSHLNDQLTRYWRGWLESNRGAMPREQLIRSAERLMTFYLARINDPGWPRIEQKLALVDQARDNLRRVVRGMPARERVYADIRARANTRFPGMTVARIVGEQDQGLIAGSYAVAGAYTREAWEKYIDGAIRDAATHELQSADWVLKTAARDDLTLEGSPEQIQQGLVRLYKADYAREWQKFVQGVTIANLNGFDAALTAMNRLGDPQSSPILKLLTAIERQTAWDNPVLANAELAKVRSGFWNWLTDAVMRRAPSPVGNVNLQIDPARFDKVAGPIGREFAGVGKLLAARDKDASLMRGYMVALSKLRSRLNTLKNQGDPGPGARLLMQQTLEGSGSELADALRYVDEQMLTGMSDSQKQGIRPILVRPLMQTFAVIVKPTEAEINKTWLAQVYAPFQQSLAGKYPFSPASRIEAGSAEIAQFFGPDGLIAKFVTTAMGPLVLRRGDVLASRTWADMGLTLAPQTIARFPGWIAPIGAGGVATASATAQTVFQVQPLPAPGTLEYTLDIDGQQLRYRNTPPQWTSMVHPSPLGAPGARITALAFDGRSVEVFNEPGQFGLKRLIDAAGKTRRDDGGFELRWSSGAITVALGLKITSSPESSGGGGGAGGAPQEQGFKGMKLPDSIVGSEGGVVAVVAGTAGTAP